MNKLLAPLVGIVIAATPAATSCSAGTDGRTQREAAIAVPQIPQGEGRTDTGTGTKANFGANFGAKESPGNMSPKLIRHMTGIMQEIAIIMQKACPGLEISDGLHMSEVDTGQHYFVQAKTGPFVSPRIRDIACAHTVLQELGRRMRSELAICTATVMHNPDAPPHLLSNCIVDKEKIEQRP